MVIEGGRRDTCTEFGEEMKGSVHLEGLGVERKIILK